MRTLSLFTLSVVLSLSLCARENPFEMTNLFEEETGKIFETNGAPMTPEVCKKPNLFNKHNKKWQME